MPEIWLACLVSYAAFVFARGIEFEELGCKDVVPSNRPRALI